MYSVLYAMIFIALSSNILYISRMDSVETNTTLTDKQDKFCLEYLVDLNQTKAALRAGYSPKTAYSIGNENLKKPEIQKRLKYYQENIAQALNLTALTFAKEWKKIAFSNISDILELNGDEVRIVNNSKLTDLPREITDCISEIKQGKDGISFKLYCKDNALVQLQKLLGFDKPEKIDMTSKGESIIRQPRPLIVGGVVEDAE